MNSKERLKEIAGLIFGAMEEAKDVDWTRHSPEIEAAFSELNEVVTQYADGETSKANVRTVYQRWRDLHKVEAQQT